MSYWGDLRNILCHPTRELNLTSDANEAHVVAMRKFVARDGNHKEINDWLVSNLDALDRKQQGVLLLNAVVLAVATLLYPRIKADLGTIGLVAIVATMAVLIYSCMSLALLNLVYWTKTAEFRSADSKPLFSHLLDIRERRTRILWVAVWLVALCLVAILLLIILDAVFAN